MINLIIDAVKVLSARETLDAGSRLLAAIRRNEGWKDGVCNIKMKVSGKHRRYFDLLRDVCTEKIIEVGFSSNEVAKFRCCFDELSKNLVEHGNTRFGNPSCEIEITKTYVAQIFRNASRKNFDLKGEIEEKRYRFEYSNWHVRGRGLLVVESLSDVLSQPDKYSVEAIVYKDGVVLDELYKEDDAVVLQLVRGMRNPKLGSVILESKNKYKGKLLILDFSLYEYEEPDTALVGDCVILHKDLLSTNGRLIVVPPKNVTLLLPEEMLVENMEDAIKLLAKPKKYLGTNKLNLYSPEPRVFGVIPENDLFSRDCLSQSINSDIEDTDN